MSFLAKIQTERRCEILGVIVLLVTLFLFLALVTDEYQGTIISDFYGVYFRLPYKKQKCLVHLLRELRTTAKNDDTTEYQFFYKQVKRLVRDAVRLKENKPALSAYVFQRKFKRIKKRLFMLIGGKGSDNKNVSRKTSSAYNKRPT